MERYVRGRGGDYYVNGMTYSAAGAEAGATIGQIAGGTPFAQSWTYNSRLQAKRMSGGNLLTLQWAYGSAFDVNTFVESSADNNGNVRAEKVEYLGGGSPKKIERGFGYDTLNRITSFSEDTAKTQNFGYDWLGNIWQVGAANGVPALAQTGPEWYRLSAPPAGSKVKNRLNGVTYDEAGNQEDLSVNGTAVKVRYDAEGRMVKVENLSTSTVIAEYSYDAAGQRIKKTAVFQQGRREPATKDHEQLSERAASPSMREPSSMWGTARAEGWFNAVGRRAAGGRSQNSADL